MSDLPYNPKDIKVLVVDDHDLIRKSIAKILTKMKFDTIIQCSNGKDAVEVMMAQQVDLVFCDIYMQGATGFDVLEFIRNQDINSDIPVIVVSGEASKDDIIKSVEIGADDYMLKPFQAAEFEKKVTQVLTSYHSPSPLLKKIREAERQLTKRQFDKALEKIQEGLKIDPNSTRAHHLCALIKDRMGDTGEAIVILKDNCERNPSYLKNYYTLAEMYLRIGNTAEAIRSMRKELKIHPKQPKRQVQLAKLLHGAGDLAGAMEHYRQALLEKGKMKTALFGMGKVYAEAGNLEKAIYYFKRLRRHHPRDARSLEAIVQYALQAKQPNFARTTLLDEKRQNPKRLDTYVVLAKFFSSTEQDDEGLKVIDEALAQSPGFIEAIRIKGAIHEKLGHLDAALECYLRVVKEDKDPNLFLKIAKILIEKQQCQEAITVLHQILEDQPQVAATLYLLAKAYLKSQQIAKAYFLACQLLNLGIKDADLVELGKETRNKLAARRSPQARIAS